MYRKWIEGDVNLDLELQSALSEKSSQFGYADLSILKELIQEHVASSEKKMTALGKTGPSIQAAQLERQAFEIAVANLKHDLDVYKVFFTRTQDRESAVFFQQLQHKQARKSAAKDIAKSLCDRASSLWKGEALQFGVGKRMLARIPEHENAGDEARKPAGKRPSPDIGHAELGSAKFLHLCPAISAGSVVRSFGEF